MMGKSNEVPQPCVEILPGSAANSSFVDRMHFWPASVVFVRVARPIRYTGIEIGLCVVLSPTLAAAAT